MNILLVRLCILSNVEGCSHPNWLVVSTPLKKYSSIGMMKFPVSGKIQVMFQSPTNQLVNWDDYPHFFGENKSHVPNHQEDI